MFRQCCPLFCTAGCYHDWFIFHDVEGSRKRANFTPAQTFQIYGPVQLAVGFKRTGIASVSDVQTADQISRLQACLKMQYLSQQR
jgi:hypothetical protein